MGRSNESKRKTTASFRKKRNGNIAIMRQNKRTQGTSYLSTVVTSLPSPSSYEEVHSRSYSSTPPDNEAMCIQVSQVCTTDAPSTTIKSEEKQSKPLGSDGGPKMDFVISNVTTVDEDDDEPLYEVKKVQVFREKKEQQIDTQSKVKVTTYKKTCYVPLCPSSSVSTPEKMFITIPVNPVRRKQWLDVVGKTNGKNPKSPMFCCQDHFDLETDMKNYEEHLRKGKVQMLLYQTVVPHIFICNDYGHLKRLDRIVVLKKLHGDRSRARMAAEDGEEEHSSNVNHTMQSNTIVSRQMIVQEPKRRKLSVSKASVMPNKTVFIEMPAFEFDDKPEYVEIKENGMDTIVIEDSDSEES